MNKTTERSDRPSGPMDRFLSSFSLVSRIPVRNEFVWDISRLDFHLPLVGLPVALLSAVSLLGPHAFGVRAMFCAIVSLGAQYFSFNLFHLDGLMHSADALLGHGDGEKKQAMLNDSRIGVYAFFVGFLYLSLKVTLLVEIVSRIDARGALAAAAFFAYPIAGRAAGALVPAMAPQAKAVGAQASRVVRGAAFALAAVTIAGFAAASREGSSLSARSMAAILLAWPLTALAAFASVGFISRCNSRSVDANTVDARGAAVEIGELLYMLTAVVVSESGY